MKIYIIHYICVCLYPACVYDVMIACKVIECVVMCMLDVKLMVIISAASSHVEDIRYKGIYLLSVYLVVLCYQCVCV